MGIGLRHSIVLALVLSFSSLAIKPAFAQTVTVTPPPAYPPPGQQPPPAYPPPAQQPPPGYPPPGYPPPGYPPPAYQYAPPAPYYPPQPSGPPPMVHRPRRGFLVGGLVTFGVTWGLALLISSVAQGDNSGSGCSSDSCRATARYFWIPVVGPVAAEASAPGGGENFTFATLWSLAEAAGVVMTIVGIIGHDVPDYSYSGRRRAKLELIPTLSPDSHGMALRARF
jgi:hypothetical protein